MTVNTIGLAQSKHWDLAAQLRWRIQPVTGERGRKLWSQVIHGLGAEHFGQAPWYRILRELWEVTDDGDRRWLLAHLEPTPFGHFREAVARRKPAAQVLPRTFIRCLKWRHSSFDSHAEMAQQTPGWQYRALRTSHLPFVTHPLDLAELLAEIAA